MGGKGSGGMGGGDIRQMAGPWHMQTNWGGSPSSGLTGAFPAGGQFSAGGGFGRMGGYPGAAPWSGGQPWGSSMQAQGMGQTTQGALPGTAASQPLPMGSGDPAAQVGPQTGFGGKVSIPPWLRGDGGMGAVPPPGGGVATTDMGMPGGSAGTGTAWAPSQMVPQMSTNDPAPGMPGGYAGAGMGMPGGGSGMGFTTPWGTFGAPRRFF